MSRLTLLLPFLLILVPFAKAAGTVQDLWIFPKAPDFTSELTVNTTIQIRWHEELQAVFAQFCTLCDTTNVDLWVTGSQYAEAVGAAIDVTSTFSYSWKVDLTESIVAASPDWSFRFLPSGAVWNGTGGQEISSAQFSVVIPPESTTTTTTSATSTTTTTSTSSTSTATKTPSPTPTPTPLPEGDDALSAGAKAGIGIGAAAGAILLIGLVIFFWRRRKVNKEPIPAYDAASDAKFQPAPGYASLGSHSHSPPRSMEVHEVPTEEFREAAVVGKAAAELGGGGVERAEMDAGVHGGGSGSVNGNGGGRGVAFELEGSR
ncbi:hypothetical protein BJX68DRAFT_264053 [Aspergillus pseudodeflectus]|uniref:Mid2 domain-containing protein n=1 Tax=Aspergillus pseudodeflectus TaxID=176178 RepID=A0ABR4KTT5_9EURO